jgi:hypothetical protein
MKISSIRFFRGKNSDLNKPVPNLPEDAIVYFTDKGFAYAEGINKPVECFDSTVFDKIASNPIVSMNIDESLVLGERDNQMATDFLVENIALVSYIKHAIEGTLIGAKEETGMDIEDIKAKLQMLRTFGFIRRMGSKWKIHPNAKQQIEFYLDRQKLDDEL